MMKVIKKRLPGKGLGILQRQVMDRIKARGKISFEEVLKIAGEYKYYGGYKYARHNYAMHLIKILEARGLIPQGSIEIPEKLIAQLKRKKLAKQRIAKEKRQRAERSFERPGSITWKINQEIKQLGIENHNEQLRYFEKRVRELETEPLVSKKRQEAKELLANLNTMLQRSESLQGRTALSRTIEFLQSQMEIARNARNAELELEILDNALRKILKLD